MPSDAATGELSATSPRREFFAGVRAELPLLPGIVPFGLIYGALAIQLGVPAAVAQAMSAVIFAGSSQFIAVPLIAAATPGIVIVVTVAIVNLRHALYSASVAPYIERLSAAWKLLLAYLLTDEAYAVTIPYLQKNPDHPFRHWFYLGAGVTLWTCWQLSTAAGILVGAAVPTDWSLEFVLPLTFIAIVVPMLKTRPAVIAALVAGAASAAAFGLPYKLGLMLAMLLGIGAGMFAFGRTRKES